MLWNSLNQAFPAGYGLSTQVSGGLPLFCWEGLKFFYGAPTCPPQKGETTRV